MADEREQWDIQMNRWSISMFTHIHADADTHTDLHRFIYLFIL